MITLSGPALVVARFARPATLRRSDRGRKPNGTFEPTSADTPITAVIQSATERDMRLVPEGERTEAYATIWTEAELRVADEEAGTPADEVVAEDGSRFKVYRVAERVEGGFTRAIGRLIRDGGRRV